MKVNVGRLGTWFCAWFCALALCAVAACAQGTPAAPVTVVQDAPAIMVAPACGNGKPDMGEMCDCKPGVTLSCLVEGTTCDMVMSGYTGTLLCDSKSCAFDFSMCAPIGAPTGTGGTGAAAK